MQLHAESLAYLYLETHLLQGVRLRTDTEKHWASFQLQMLTCVLELKFP